MRRRDFVKVVTVSAITWPLAARAQQAVPVVGFLSNATPESYAPFVAAFRRGLGQAGFAEGQNVTVDYRWGRNQAGQLNEAAKDFVQRGVKVIVASAGDQAIDAARAATQAIPIVAALGSDPVESGLVHSLSRPEGNLTGVSVFAVQLVPKQLQLARELAPDAQTIAFLENPNNPTGKIGRAEFEEAGRGLGQHVVIVDLVTEGSSEAAFASLVQNRTRAVIVQSDPFFNGLADRLVELAARFSLPAIFPRREFVVAGGLMSYGSSLTEAYRQIGIYTGRVLKGDKPSDLPIVLPSKYELIVNLKTARASGVDVPTSILLRADEVIE
jgi:putative ABC transport system substrate-binding protein